MTTIFGDFCQFSAILANFRRKIGVFLKKQCEDQFVFKKTAVVWAKKRQFFRQYFGENIF
jgi:hypothetical protein